MKLVDLSKYDSCPGVYGFYGQVYAASVVKGSLDGGTDSLVMKLVNKDQKYQFCNTKCGG
jgi:hypothetical protein